MGWERPLDEMRTRHNHITQTLVSVPYKYLLVPLSCLYFIATFTVVIYMHGSVGAFYTSLRPQYTIPFTILAIITSVQLGIAITLAVAKIRELRAKSAGLGVIGIVVGSLAAGCPGCFFGLFPIILSAFGVSATLAILPWNGLELQAASAVILALSIITLAKETDMTCDVRTSGARTKRRGK